MRKKILEPIKNNCFLFTAITVVLIANINYVMNHVLMIGSGMLDVGWFIHLITSSDNFPAQNPNVGALGATYFSVHISPFFYLTTLIYSIVQDTISQQLFFAIFMGFGYSLMALSAYLAGKQRAKLVSEKIFLSFLSVIIALNGVFLGSIGFPHFEIIIPSLILLSITLYSCGKMLSAIVTTTLLLFIREDAGLHAALFFTAFSALYFLQYRKLHYRLLILSAIGIIYSFSVIAIQKVFFEGDNAFERIYSGTPPYSHLTWDFLTERIDFFISNRAYIWAPWVVAIVSSIKLRNYMPLTGLIFAVPWTILSISAVAPMTNSFSNYYAFPLAISCVWPIFCLFIIENLSDSYKKHGKTDIGIAASAPILSILLFSGSYHLDETPWREMDFNYMEIASNTQNTLESICHHKDDLGITLVDEPVSALIPSCLSPDEWGFLNHFHEGLKTGADTIIFYDSQEPINGSSIAVFLDISKKSGIEKLYNISGTKILIGSKIEGFQGIDFKGELNIWNPD